MINRPDDFFDEVADPNGPWGAPVTTKTFKTALMLQLAKGPILGDDALSTAIALIRLVHREFEAYGTDSSNQLSDEESREAHRALRFVLQRQGIAFKPPWRDFTSFRSHWLSNDASGSWQARRDILDEYFRPALDALEEAEERAFRGDLATGISPRGELGWPDVDDHLNQLRMRFRSASTPVDYKDVGNRCVGVLESLSAVVYDPALDCPPGESAPPVDKTDIRLGAYIARRLPGKQNEELRGLVKKTSALAHRMKHSSNADRTTTGIAADAVILLANILRRLREQP